ncbi:prolyl oligopeptidase family serine peptidase [Aquimarina litoralis]|uniref:prolyl oligopeptidase family serine peptidase n=1 Tax=Aquimarina litoralis TaxID=584605 RepID=UPI001C57C268|nr:prolyl oligopeptidase family serine peptidase [Aquimarina litoralis]MBW1297800.1 prolyl oligopeptidase family serine peptidase [Aquimarina litoralis]
MKYITKLGIKGVAIMLLLFTGCGKETTLNKPSLAPEKLVVDTYHGTQIEDHYRNLENLEDSTVIKWLKEQGDFAFNILDKIPGRQKLIEQLQSYDRKQNFSYSLFKRTINGIHFYAKTIGDEKVAKLYYRKDFDDEEVLLYDPSVRGDEDPYRISLIQPDHKGEKIVICLGKKGEELSEGFIMDVATKEVLPLRLKNVLHSFIGVRWLSDNSGVFYLYSPITDPTDKDFLQHTKTVLCKIGHNTTPIFSKESKVENKINPEDFPLVYNFDPKDGYLFGVVGGSDSFYDIYYARELDVLSNSFSWKLLFKKEDKVKRHRVTDDGDLIYLSSKNAVHHQILKTSIENPDIANAEILVPEKEDATIISFTLTKNGLFYTTLKNGVEAKLYFVNHKGEEKEIIPPRSSGNISVSSYGIGSDFLRVITSGRIAPSINYFYDVIKNEFKRDRFIPVNEYPEFEEITVEETEISSHDEVKVPITIIKNKNVKRDGNNPTLFFGYGSYGKIARAYFNPSFLTWVSNGGILVFAHVRGDGYKGEAWHQAGFKTTKPNTWKDMIATTEYMIAEGYTTPEKSALWGSSAGGILAGRAMTERPDLYKAVILTSPATNMLRSEVQPNGKNSIKEFGTVEIEEEFHALLEMDSYHHIEKDVEYPATLVTGGMKDGRVVVWDPAKFVAKLQAYNGADTPTIFAVKTDQGHSASNSGKMDRYELYANAFSFALWQMGYEEYQPKD